MDWQVGDLALCVDAGPSLRTGLHSGLVVGKTYAVVGVEITPDNFYDAGELGLFIDDDPIPDGTPWAAGRFRKIKPDTEPCEEEFTVLIKRMKPAKVGA